MDHLKSSATLHSWSDMTGAMLQVGAHVQYRELGIAVQQRGDAERQVINLRSKIHHACNPHSLTSPEKRVSSSRMPSCQRVVLWVSPMLT